MFISRLFALRACAFVRRSLDRVHAPVTHYIRRTIPHRTVPPPHGNFGKLVGDSPLGPIGRRIGATQDHSVCGCACSVPLVWCRR